MNLVRADAPTEAWCYAGVVQVRRSAHALGVLGEVDSTSARCITAGPRKLHEFSVQPLGEETMADFRKTEHMHL